MSKTALGIIIAVVSLGLIAGIIFVTMPKDRSATSTRPTTSGSASTTSQATESSSKTDPITAETVAEHTSATDCWTIINDVVYDISDYVRNHPGGSEILRACGTDGSQLFNSRRDGSERVGSGTPHSSSARNILADFQIGTLAR